MKIHAGASLSPWRARSACELLVRAAIAAALAGSIACTTTEPARFELLSDEAVVLPLPLIEQDASYECGLAAVDVLCGYWGLSIPEDRRLRMTELAAEHEGLSGAELREELELVGFEVFLFEGTLDRSETGLYQLVDSGWPALVMTASRSGTPHYVLFLGYDEPNGNVCLLDPARGRVVEAREVFDHAWSECRRFTLLAIPPSDTPPTQEQP
jgi:ABC-type bacteriocin/lantibiotic exporter with double-glycine peptidase domain